MSDKKHAKLAPSASHRWTSCPGSIRLCEKAPPPAESPYAEEGTAAHALAEYCLKNNIETYEYPYSTVEIAKNKFAAVNDEMLEGVQEYINTVRNLTTKNSLVLIEQEFLLEWLVHQCKGTSDAVILDKDEKKLYVLDLKYGKGVIVNPDWNSQGMIYALGALYEIVKMHRADVISDKPIEQIVKTVEIVIVQPRAYHPEGSIRRWEIAAKDLLFWGVHVLKPLAEETFKDNAPLKTGEYCRFCPALAICPEQVKTAMAIAKTQFENPILPEPHLLTPSDISKVLEVSDVFNSWASEVRAYAQRQMEMGVKLPGYKLVQKRSIRKWIDENAAESSLINLLGEDAYEKKVLSVAKAEKELSKRGISVEANILDLIEKPDNGLVLAPESDKRKAVEPLIAAEFLEIENFLQ